MSESEWVRFVDREITPRFPDGLTVVDAAGQWRDRASNKILREPSKVVMIVLPGMTTTIARLERDRRGLQDPLQAAVGRPDRAAGLRVVLGRQKGAGWCFPACAGGGSS